MMLKDKFQTIRLKGEFMNREIYPAGVNPIKLITAVIYVFS
jgi:hypothetical protein